MTLNYKVSGESRKQLVYMMAELLECKPRYLMAPTYAYQVGDYNVSRNGEVSFDDRTVDSEEVEMLIDKLEERGFIPEAVPEEKAAAEPASATKEPMLDNLPSGNEPVRTWWSACPWKASTKQALNG